MSERKSSKRRGQANGGGNYTVDPATGVNGRCGDGSHKTGLTSAAAKEERSEEGWQLWSKSTH